MLFRYLAFRFKYRLGYAAGLFLSIAGLALLMSDNQAAWHSPGPANHGHEQLPCSDCHREGEGSARQQIQANLKHQLGLRKHEAYFQFRPVSNAQCLACHDRPNDPHLVHRFNEPRFAETRAKLHPETCVSCHVEHRGVRITLQNAGFCQSCHEDFSLKEDPVSIPHRTLAQQQRWETCLGCHDYHGNHRMDVPTEVDNAIAPAIIGDYFNGAASPYPGPVIQKAKEKPDES